MTEQQYDEYYYKVHPKEICKFFNIKYKLFDKIEITLACEFGYPHLELSFKYKTIFLNEKSINKFLKYKKYDRFRMYSNCDNCATKSYIYGVKFNLTAKR